LFFEYQEKINPAFEERMRVECERTGEPLPDRIANAPELDDDLLFYFDAYLELSTERQIGMTAGPIPVSSLWAYCDRLIALDVGFDSEDVYRFERIIKGLDSIYLTNQKNKIKQDAKK
jgi:hypothetical protein